MQAVELSGSSIYITQKPCTCPHFPKHTFSSIKGSFYLPDSTVVSPKEKKPKQFTNILHKLVLSKRESSITLFMENVNWRTYET